MKRNKIWLIVKKEWDRFFGDKRTLLGLVLPAVVMYVAYAFLMPLVTGSLMNSILGTDATPTIYVTDAPAPVRSALENAGLTVAAASREEESALREAITGKSGDFLLIFPPGFERDVAAYDMRSGAPAPNIRLYYNSGADGYIGTSQTLNDILTAYEAELTNKFDVNRDESGDTGEEGAAAAKLVSDMMTIMLPMFLLMFMFTGATATAVESITGEKERGTFATVFITPIRVGEIAAGKILGLGIEAFVSGFLNALAVLLAFPRYIAGMRGDSGAGEEAASMMNFSLSYGPLDYVILFLVILTTTYLIVAVVALVSAYAKTVKEAQMLLTPLTFVVMFVGMSGMFNAEGMSLATAFIPLSNSAHALVGIFSMDYSLLPVALTILANTAYSLLGCWGLARLFKSEELMFAR